MALKKLIRIQITMPEARGGTTPLDATTGLPPAFWQNEAVDIDVGLFTDADNTADTTNLTKLGLMISERPGHDAPIFEQETGAGATLDTTVSKANWDAGDAHGKFVIAVGDLTTFLGADASKVLYLSLWAIDAGVWVHLANGQCTIHAAPPVGS